MDHTPPNAVRHREFYIRGGDVTFLVSKLRVVLKNGGLKQLLLQVENHVLFRVHRYFFKRDSPFFASKLAVPAAPGAPMIGTTDGNAFALDVTVSDFENFLWVFYNP
jgi:hypothetical protein